MARRAGEQLIEGRANDYRQVACGREESAPAAARNNT
jgi:hypothetical protein